jgi:hypothetical protein
MDPGGWYEWQFGALNGNWSLVPSWGTDGCGAKRFLFCVFCFPYVCPEPVLVKSCILYINGAKSGVFCLATPPFYTNNRTFAKTGSGQT